MRKPARTIVERLESGDVLLLDGGIGSEIEARGVDVWTGLQLEDDQMDDGDPTSAHTNYLEAGTPEEMRRTHEATLRRVGPWCAPANIDAPDVVRSVNEDYLRLGADITMSNTFWTNRSKLGDIGLGDRWERYARAGVELAVQARDAVNPEAYVAGTMAPSHADDLRTEFSAEARVLADAGVDLLFPEYLGSIDECVTAIEACAQTGLPTFIAVRHVSEDGRMQYLETFADLAKAIDGLPVSGVLIMCSLAKNISVALPKLRAAFDGPIGAYPNNPASHEGRLRPEEFADYGREWLAAGAQVIGGCCQVGPELIKALVPVVKEQPLPA